MKRTLIVLFSALMLASCRGPNVAQDSAKPGEPARGQADTSSFTLGPSDQITINVWRNTDLTRTVSIDPAGNINMPLAGEIKAAGLSIAELKGKIEASLTKYINNPQVDVTIASIKSAKVHVLGEVKSPGSYAMDRNLKPLEAVAAAGGFSTSANKSNVLVVRNKEGKAEVLTVNLNMRTEAGRDSVVKAEDLRSGDVVYVLPTKMADVESFMTRFKNIISPFVTVEQGIVLWPQVVDAVKNTETAGQNKTPMAITP